MLIFKKGTFNIKQVGWLYARMMHSYVDNDCDEDCTNCEYRQPCADIKRLCDYLFELCKER